MSFLFKKIFVVSLCFISLFCLYAKNNNVNAICIGCGGVECFYCGTPGQYCSCSGYTSEGWTTCSFTLNYHKCPRPTYECSRCSNNEECAMATFDSHYEDCSDVISGSVVYSVDYSCNCPQCTGSFYSWNGSSCSSVNALSCSDCGGSSSCYESEVACVNDHPASSTTDTGTTTVNTGATTAPTACPSCTPVSFFSPSCYATINDPPELEEFKIFNNEDIEVEVDMVDIGGSKNHICQSEFNGVRQLTFQAEVSDPDGNSVTGVLTLNGKVIPVLNGVSTGISNPLTFGWTGGEFIPTDYNNSNTSELILTLSDSNYSKPFSPRSFKIWDCQMPISGSFYDATEAADNDLFDFCPTDGFTKIVEDRNVLNFTSLRFKEPDANDDESIAMTVNPSGVDYGSASNYLIWGKEYEISFNPDISLTRWEMRYNGICSNTTLKTSNIDPYPSDTSIIADFTGILIQDPWWQTSEGGVVSNNSVSGKVPVTCTEENTCDDNMSINAFVIAPTIEKKSDQDKYLMQNSAKIANPTTNNYEYFFKQYYAKKGIGETIGTEGEKVIINDSVTQLFSNPSDTYIYFVNGDLEINDNIVRNSSFLMFIVKGNVTVNANVNRVDGLIVASNIYASSTQNTATNNQLVFNGSLFAYDNISFTRGYADRTRQNEEASVLIKYDPQLIFKIPGSLAKVLTSWQWGN